MLFDGYLICSDWDSTLYYKTGVGKRDMEAIRYFQDNGGLFTISSGRSYNYIKDYFDSVKPNTYIITLNGAIIVEPESGKRVYEGFLPSSAVELVDFAISIFDTFNRIDVYFEPDAVCEQFSTTKFPALREKILNNRIYKLLLVGNDAEKVLRAKQVLVQRKYSDLYLARSWPVGLEIMSEKSAKGYAARRVKELTDSRCLITVGDFENDIQMIEFADLGYAVGNATDSLKAVADRVTVHVEKGAIAQIIEDIEKEIKSSAAI